MAEKTFRGRVVVGGAVSAKALVSHGGFNTLASYQQPLILKNVKAPCSDQNNPDLYKKPLQGAAICLPQTIGSTTGGMVLMCACDMGAGPACMLFSKPIDPHCRSGRHSRQELDRAPVCRRRPVGRRVSRATCMTAWT
jgi:predicted aconitase with swiveling domain